MNSTETALLERIHATIDRIDGRTVELQNSINDKMAFLPAGLQTRVRRSWDDFCALLRRVWDNLTTIMSNMGSLSALSTTAQAWSDRVGVPVSGQVQAADAGLLTVDDNWDGDAADAYRQMLPLQKAALEKIKTTITDGMATALARSTSASSSSGPVWPRRWSHCRSASSARWPPALRSSACRRRRSSRPARR